jgi:hypothetical protein
VKRIPLRARDGSVRAYTLVDDEDFLRFGGLRWALHSQGYAYRQRSRAGGLPARTLLLHRLIMGLEHGDPREVDHKNRDRLDCRRHNLRVVTSGGNSQNQGAHRDGSSRFRGVSLNRPTGTWRAMVYQEYLGLYATELEAAQVAQARRLEVMPDALPDPELERALAIAA